MKTCLPFALAGLVTVIAVSALGLSGDLAGNVRALEQLAALTAKLEAGVKEQNAAALAALFTQDAVCVTSHGVFSGRNAIERILADEFQRSPATSQIVQTDQLHPIGKGEAWSIGQWWKTLQSSRGPIFISGYWSAIIVPEGDAWKFRMLSVSEASRLGPSS
jgi:Domain of unknown function (DUF4440)